SALPAAAGNNNNVGSPGLSYNGAPTYPASIGNTATEDASAANATNNVSRLIGQTIDSGTLYFSFLMQRNNTTLRTTNISFFGPSVGTTAPSNVPERVSIGQIGASSGTSTN